MKLFVASGVTTVRGVLGAPNQLAMRDRIRKGELLGPQLFVYGPPLHGDPVKTPEVGVQKVKEFKQAGYDGIKIQEGLSLDSYQAIAREAKRLRFPFGGHVPNDVGLERALAAGQKSIEHLDGYLEALAPPGAPSATDAGQGSVHQRALTGAGPPGRGAHPGAGGCDSQGAGDGGAHHVAVEDADGRGPAGRAAEAPRAGLLRPPRGGRLDPRTARGGERPAAGRSGPQAAGPA